MFNFSVDYETKYMPHLFSSITYVAYRGTMSVFVTECRLVELEQQLLKLLCSEPTVQ